MAQITTTQQKETHNMNSEIPDEVWRTWQREDEDIQSSHRPRATNGRGTRSQSLNINRIRRGSPLTEISDNFDEDDDLTDPPGADAEDLYNRKEVRLNGLEVYAVVSAVTAGTLVAVLDSYNPEDVSKLWADGNYLDIAISAIFLTSGTVGIVSSLHCIIVFSLTTMYGRTALGMHREEALESFFAETGLQRYNGHQSFVYSLYALMVELIIVITAKFSQNTTIHVISLAVCSRLMYLVHADTQHIMEKAAVIYMPPPLITEESRGNIRQRGSILRRDRSRDTVSAMDVAATDFISSSESGSLRAVKEE